MERAKREMVCVCVCVCGGLLFEGVFCFNVVHGHTTLLKSTQGDELVSGGHPCPILSY